MPEKADGAGLQVDLAVIPAGTPSPKVSASVSSLATARSDIAICFAFEGDRRPSFPGLATGSSLFKTLSLLMKDESFKGKRKEILLWHAVARLPAARYMIVGLGKRSAMSLGVLREACGLAARRAAGARARRIAMALPPPYDNATMEQMAEAATEGIELGAYRMAKYLTGDEAKPLSLKSAELLVPKGALAQAQLGVSSGRVRGSATNFVRDLVNEPAKSLTPRKMAEVARAVAKERSLEIRVHEKKDLERMGMGALLGVSAGSAQPPCLIHLIYRPAAAGRRAPKRAARRIALVGKGLTFDSGGLSLKTAAGMETMKLDKAGASAVLGVMRALPELKPPIEVHGILGMTENMPGGSAIKPGDILKTMGGKTIEVLNTDAEGRLVLADALAYAQKQDVDQIIDLATLTGACMVALGPVVTGVFGPDQEMVDRLLMAAERAGEKMWQLPLLEDYNDQLRSDIADIKNIPTSRYGGAITAALFLHQFVDGKVPWIHLDIAGPAFFETEHGFMRKGATGVGVRTLLSYIQSLGDGPSKPG